MTNSLRYYFDLWTCIRKHVITARLEFEQALFEQFFRLVSITRENAPPHPQRLTTQFL